jgi:transcriptional regulator with XRE-family HTH domain
VDRRSSAESFARAARPYTPRQLADAADVTIEAAKYWLEAKRAPSAANLINMAQSLPFVLEWFQREAAVGNRIAQSRSTDGTLIALYEAAKRADPDGDLSRVLLAAIRRSDGVGE